MNNNGLQIHDFSAQAQKIYILSSSTGTVHETTQLENCSLDLPQLIIFSF